MTEPHPYALNDRHRRRLAIILGVGAVVLAGGVVAALIFKEIPPRNEILLGTVVGFIFGNMVGPAYRAVFGGDDSSREVANQAVNALATSTPTPEPAEVTLRTKREAFREKHTGEPS